jgi:hypothetical protein
MERKLLWALACAPIIAIFAADAAVADALTRSGCWVATYSDGKSILCFRSSSRATMAKTATALGTTSTSTCFFSGDYIKSEESVTVTFPDHSGKCTNNALSPEITVVCTFTGDKLTCKGSQVMLGKTYEFKGIFK